MTTFQVRTGTIEASAVAAVVSVAGNPAYSDAECIIHLKSGTEISCLDAWEQISKAFEAALESE